MASSSDIGSGYGYRYVLISMIVGLIAVLLVLGGCYNSGYKTPQQKDSLEDAQAGNLEDLDELSKDLSRSVAAQEPAADPVDDESAESDGSVDDGSGDDEEVTVVSASGEVLNVSIPATTADAADESTSSDQDSSDEESSSSSLPTVTVTEGDIVDMHARVRGRDPDGDNITYAFSAPISEDGRWETSRGDAGTYTIMITASDGKTSVVKKLQLEVRAANHAPVISVREQIDVDEGDTVYLSFEITDEDGDQVTSSVSGWMDSGKKTASFDDAGDYTVTVSASDGTKTVTKDVKIHVRDVNRAPEFEIVLG